MGFYRGVSAYLGSLRRVNRNCWLGFAAAALNGISQGIFTVIFNLYILSLGITPDILGAILSAGPFAQALGSIPMGFLMETIGFKKVFLIIYLGSGLAKLAQVATGSVPLISLAAFASGLALAGDFVVRLPFLAANSEPEERAHIYSLSSMIFGLSVAFGALFAGYAPNLLAFLHLDLSIAYRYTLYIAGALPLLAAIPILMLENQAPLKSHKISLAPYLWGIDRFTTQQAVVSLFVGVSMGLTTTFMNVYFIYHLGTTREYFGTVSALVVIPVLAVTAIGPLLALRTGIVRIVTYLRTLIAVFIVNLALTNTPWLGTLAYWGQSSLSNSAQPLSFAFAMDAASRKAKSAASAWLNVTYWLGTAIAAPIGGAFLTHSNYLTPLFIAGASILAAGLLNEFFFNPVEISLRKKRALEKEPEIEIS